MESKTVPFLTAEHINKKFGSITALEDVSLSVCQGEILAIAGDNGAGKTTLIKIMSGVIRPDSGTIVIGGKEYRELTPAKAIKAGISTVYQDLALGNTMDVTSNIFLGNERTSAGFLKKREMDEAAEKLIEGLDIHIADVTVPVGRLSGGQRQGVAVARLISRSGKLLIFDEPTAAMGLNESRSVLKLIRRLAGEGYGVIMISHNLPQILQVADRVCIMRQGRVIRELETSDITLEELEDLISGNTETGSQVNHENE